MWSFIRTNIKLSILSVQVSALPLPECVLMLDQIKHVFIHKTKVWKLSHLIIPSKIKDLKIFIFYMILHIFPKTFALLTDWENASTKIYRSINKYISDS